MLSCAFPLTLDIEHRFSQVIVSLPASLGSFDKLGIIVPLAVLGSVSRVFWPLVFETGQQDSQTGCLVALTPPHCCSSQYCIYPIVLLFLTRMASQYRTATFSDTIDLLFLAHVSSLSHLHAVCQTSVSSDSSDSSDSFSLLLCVPLILEFGQ